MTPRTPGLKSTLILCSLAATATLCMAQASPDTSANLKDSREQIEAACSAPTANSIRTFYLANTTDVNQGNGIQVAIRSMLPATNRVFFSAEGNAILVCGTPDQMAFAEKLIHDFDRPRKSFRVTYTFTETDGGKRVGTQHYAMIVSDGQRAQVKEGSKVPLATGSYSGTSQAAVQTQFQYIDVGMNFDATFTATTGGGLLKTKVEESSVIEEKPVAGVQEPVLRQSTYEGSPMLVFGKPAVLNSLDLPNSTRHVDLEVMVEEIK
jgi:type II secretory pathway component GspD/PulD (secretin)